MNIELDKVVVHFKTKFPEVRVVKGILTDIFPKEGPEINLLTIVYKSGYVEKLVSMSQCTQRNIEAAVVAINKETFLANSAVKEALTMWLRAYHELEAKKQAGSTTALIQQNPDEAVKWLRKAAELGSQEAMLKLGTLLYNDKRTFSEIIAEYEAQINKVTGLLQQSQEEYGVAENKNREYLRKISECETQINRLTGLLQQNQAAYKEAENKNREQLRKISEQEYTCGYNDAEAGKRNKYIKEEPKRFGNVMVGSIIKFGSYPQNSKDRKEPIEWRVLAVKNRKALLISKYALDCKKYNETYGSTAWEKCTLRKWLNSNFIKEAFTDNEQNSILLSDVKADKNPKYSTSQGNDTRDRVFLLGANEVVMYFKSYSDRKCVPTELIVSNGAFKMTRHCWWWLRSLGYYSYNATYVNTDGLMDYYGDNAYYHYAAVRPALWINLKY